MNRNWSKRSWLIFLIVVLLATSGGTGALGAEPAAPANEKAVLKNVVLQEGGTVSGQLENRTNGALSGVLIAALYDEKGAMVDADIRNFALEARETIPFEAAYTIEVDPLKHTAKLLVWNSLAGKRPLALPVTIDRYGLKPTDDDTIDPFSFYVGRVARSFSKEENQAFSIDLAPFIDHEAKTIRSITGQLDWDYGNGLATVDTARSQGATGLLSAAGAIDLSDVRIESGNAFGTVIVTSLDGKPIRASRKLLIQAMTEDMAYGYRSKTITEGGVEKQEITSMGTGPMNVKNIDAEVVLKQMDDVEHVYKLDANGYVTDEIAGNAADGGYAIALPEDAIYTVVERRGLKDPYKPGETPHEDPVYVWWEAEDALETNYPAKTDFSADTLPDTRHLLSGSDWLTSSHEPVNEQNPLYAKYEITVPQDAAYTMYVRKFWFHGPFRWRFDGGEWQTLGRDITLLDDTFLRQFIGANWVSMGSVQLTEGTHSFEFELIKDPESPTSYVSGMDAFLLTKQPFMPSGTLRPGEKSGLAEEGYWAFEPDSDVFSDASLIDLSHLNEDIAGQNGFVRKIGDKLVYGDGKEARFWSVNVGTGVVNLEKPDVNYFAKMLAKRGVNMVRIHGDIFDENGEITDKALDKYQYFVHALKQEGIYVDLSYYFVLWWDMRQARDFKEPGYEFFDFNKEPFGLLMFNEKQQELYKKGVRRLMNTPNPYENGLPLAKDPAVAFIEIQNEDSYLFWTFADWRFPEKIKLELHKLYGDWLKEKYGSLDAAYDAWGPLQKAWADVPEQGLMETEGIANVPWATGNDGDAKRRRDFLRFMTENQKAFYDEMADFFRNEIKSPSVLIASNWVTAEPKKLEALERYTYTATDMVDRHAYFDSSHTAVGDMYWTLQVGDKYVPQPAVLNPDKNPVKAVHNDDMPTMISEITWTHPTPYGAEGPYMLAVYGSLQGIDSLDIFASGGPAWSKKWVKWPVMSPTMMGQFPAFALLYRRGDVAEAGNVVLDVQTLESLYGLEGSRIFESLNLDDARD